MGYRMEEMLPEDFLDAVERMPVFLVPTGLMEWHGDHLPLGQDSLKAHGLCLRIAERLGGGIVLPPSYVGRPGFSAFAGTLTFSEALVNLLLTELLGQLAKVGARVIVLLTGHYGPCQVDCVKRAAENFETEHKGVRVIAMPEYEGITVDGQVPADHAGKWETSMFWRMYPELTRMDNFYTVTKRKRIYPDPPNDYYDTPEEWVWREDLRETASPELGERCIAAVADHVAALVLDALAGIAGKE